MDDITNETNIICILEIQGIKFTTRNFQIEIELKQVMALDKEPVFDNCMIKPNKKIEQQVDEQHSAKDLETPHLETTHLETTHLETANLGNTQPTSDSLSDSITNKSEKNDSNEDIPELEPIDIMIDTENNDDNISLDVEIEDLDNEPIEEDSDALKEMDVDLKLDSLETLQLKKPNQVYFELYKEARKKAKMAKKNAVLAYLEAKNIKKTYLIENINDSDSDFDAEIDDVSESELEGL